MQNVPLHAVFKFEGESIGLARRRDFALDKRLGGAFYFVEDLFPLVEAIFGFAVDGGAHAIGRFEAHLFPFVGGAVGDGGGPGGENDNALVRNFFADVGEPVDRGEFVNSDDGGRLHEISELQFAICDF